MKSKKDWSKAIIKGMKLLFDPDECTNSCTKDKNRSLENKEPLDEIKLQILHGKLICWNNLMKLLSVIHL